MRILLMADTPMNPDSGAAGTEYQTLLALRGLGHEVDAIWSDQLPHRIRHGNLHYLLELPRAYRQRVEERLRAKPYDVVHVNQPHGYLAARHVRAMGGNRPVFVHRSHGFEPRAASCLAPWERLLAPRRPPLRRAASAVMESLLEINNVGIARYADGHVVSASACAQYLRRQYGVPEARVCVIAQAAPAAFREAPVAELDESRLNRLLYVGQFAFVKGPQILAQAFEILLRQRPGATLTWVCDARHHQQAAALLAPAARARVRFVDWVPQPELMAIYDEHGVFLFPSLFEGFGKAFIEAMARGLVVVASAEGGAKDLIRDGVNGFVVPVGDAAATAQACLAGQLDIGAARRVGEQARATALEHSWERLAREMVIFYGRLTQTR